MDDLGRLNADEATRKQGKMVSGLVASINALIFVIFIWFANTASGVGLLLCILCAISLFLAVFAGAFYHDICNAERTAN